MPVKLTLDQAIERAYKAMREKNTPLAYQWVHQVYKARPEHAESQQLMGLFYNQLGSRFAAKTSHYLTQAKTQGLSTLSVLWPLAQAYLQLGQCDHAHRELDLVEDLLNPQQPAYIAILRGQIYIAEHNWGRATQIFNQLRMLADYQHLANGWLGVIACSQGHFREGLDFLTRIDIHAPQITDESKIIFAQHRKDAQANLSASLHERKILTLRHPTQSPDFYQVFLNWIKQNYSLYSGLFELRLLPMAQSNLERYALYLPWLQDPVQNWSQLAFQQAQQIEHKFHAIGTPVINPVTALHYAGKFEGARRMAAAGLNVPKMAIVSDFNKFKQDLGGLNLPLFIREDWGHGGPMLRIDSLADLEQINIAAFERPIAIEIINVRNADGLYRKYRYFAVGAYGISHHLFAQPHWITRGSERVYTQQTKTEELTYIAKPDPHHEEFQAARRSLGLDFVAFDYGYTPHGQMIIWEANPYPYIRWPSINGQSEYRVAALHRTMAAMLLFYLEQVGLQAPAELTAIVNYQTEGDAALAKMQRPA